MQATGSASAPLAGAARLAGRLSPFNIVVTLLILLTLALVVYPVGGILLRAFVVDGRIGLSGFTAAVTNPDLLAALFNTVVLVAVSGALALFVGAAFAWLNERTDASTGWTADILPLIPLLVPQIAGVTGWVMLLAPKAGVLNGLLRGLFDAVGVPMREGPLNIYTYQGLVIITALYLVPYVYLIVSAALRNLNPYFEEAARMNGAGPMKTLFVVTLPAIRPALLASALILVMLGFAFFSVPMIIGTGAGIEVLSVKTYRLLYNYPPKTDLAIMLSIFMMIIVQGALLLQAWIVRSGRYATIGGKGAPASRIRLGRWRWLAQGTMIAYVLATAVIPVIGLVIVSLQPFWTPRVVWSQLSLHNYHFVLFENDMTTQALINSLSLGAVGATIGMFVAAVLALAAHNSGGRLRAVIDGIATLPAAIPHTVIGVGFLVSFSQGWLNLYGTLTMLLLAYLVMFLPQAARSASSAVSQVGRELVEAAQVFRTPPGRTFLRILLPLMLPGLAAGWIILFVQMSGDLTASALLGGTNNPVIGQTLLDLWENGSFPQLAALAVIITVLDCAVVLLVLRYFRGSLQN
ncbi:ABC transporter permease [Azospirillum rugosum]|uniref:Iron(III) transport system permease protein n=1 Tax=Azospirillum rugosum TaxID=416170 RepID=A0ABS4SRW2_9PROT|nr:iron ABC transporter permease [Azospirillum rugosum]MBP2294964.1 iron(III) transport system permease protein [Azospirillum rugosum]MDQ0530986.1 iron(III) transport system permease protein [Azospirillum rugosum]